MGRYGRSTAGLSVSREKTKAAKARNRSQSHLKVASNKIGIVKVSDIRKSERGILNAKNGGQLLRVRSKIEREKIHKRAAEAIAAKEIRSFPPHGGRKWKCKVIVKEDTKKTSEQPLFCWFRGKIELASLPNLLDEIPTIECDTLDPSRDRSFSPLPHERKISAFSNFAHEVASNSLVVKRIWISPQLVEHQHRSTATSEAEELIRRDRLISKVVDGVGKKGKILKPRKLSKKESLEAGVARFSRDGLWVVGQEESWQSSNQQELARQNMLKGSKSKSHAVPEEYEDKIGLSCKVYCREEDLWKKGSCVDYKKKKKEYKIQFRGQNIQTFKKDVSPIIWDNARVITPSSHWRLSSRQVDMCVDACVDHFQKVMHTVKARALFAELADGFDVLRERGRGRYDMELPAFDTEVFSFLRDTNAPWCTIVRALLGQDAHLIHKGCFMSLPGADTQVYHQDGVHLSTKGQKPCHAVNVFIPLVDLTSRNGPTEFIPGTHILGNEVYVKELSEMPLVPKGTPIIFDYRLGHRGLGNSSNEIRPILYLTYAQNAKSFKDEANFSKKRYHKIGEIIDLPLSRSDRASERTKRRQEQINAWSVEKNKHL